MINILTILLGIGSIIYLAFPLRLHRRMKREEQEFQETMQEGNERMHSAAMHLYLDLALKANKTEIPIYEQPLAMYPEQQTIIIDMPPRTVKPIMMNVKRMGRGPLPEIDSEESKK